MKFLAKSTSPQVENIIFPNSRVKHKPRDTFRLNFQSPYSADNPLDTTMNNRAKDRLHLLEVTQPRLLLQKIFQPYLNLVKLLGCQPLKIENGIASFDYLSWNVAYSVLMFGMFVYDTFYFLPIMKNMNAQQNRNYFVYVTEIILVVSEICAAQMSFIFTAIRAKELVKFWNRLQAVIVKLIARCPNHLDLVPSYKTARVKVIIWLMFSVVFGTCYIVSFQDDIRNYLKSQDYNPVYYWFMFLAFTGYTIMLSFHILHSTCFITFICVMCSCNRALGNVALSQDGQGTMRNSQSPVLFQEISEIYDELMELKASLGQIYGIYLTLEILAMIICVTINIFFLISMPENSSLFFLNLSIAIPYLVWFHGICSSGDDLLVQMKKCHSNIKRAVANSMKKIPSSDVVPNHIDMPESLSASGYFCIDMRLFTTVIGTIATYLVVTLQFGAGMNMKGPQGNSSSPTRNESS